MKEAQLHQAFSLWLTTNRLAFVHARTDRRSTMTQSWPDYTICHVGKCLLLEIKTENGTLTPGQKELFAKLQTESGTVVHVVRSVEQAVSAVETWLGVDNGSARRLESNDRPSVGVRDIFSGRALFIGSISGKDYVLRGDSDPGGSATMLRLATPADLINIPRQ